MSPQGPGRFQSLQERTAGGEGFLQELDLQAAGLSKSFPHGVITVSLQTTGRWHVKCPDSLCHQPFKAIASGKTRQARPGLRGHHASTLSQTKNKTLVGMVLLTGRASWGLQRDLGTCRVGRHSA